METLEQRVAEELEAIDTEQEYDNMLDECYGDVNVAGYDYATSRLLAEVDPTAYRCGLNDYFGCSDTYYELNGEYYHIHEVDAIREELEEELESEETNEN